MGMREKLIKLLDDFSTPVMLLDTKLMDWNIPTQQLREAVADHLIANGATIPVRCKDCGGWCRNVGIKDSPNGHCFTHDIDTNGFDFCSYGERKNDGL